MISKFVINKFILKYINEAIFNFYKKEILKIVSFLYY